MGKPRRPIDYFSGDALREGLKQKTVRGGAITAIGQMASVAISLAAVPLLARLLNPEDFGLIAMVAVLTNFARMFVDAGLSMATVQREEITRQQVSNLFWIASGLGALIAIVVACLSPVIAWFYGEPRLVTITLAMAGSFVLAGMTVQHQALLRRGMQFGSLSVISVVSTLAGQIVGVAWAWNYFGTPYDYWALVLMPITTAAIRMGGTWLCCHWRPNRPQRGAGTRSLVAFGANLTGFNFANYFARNADKLLIGWWWGTTPLGFYDRASRLLLMPMQQIAPAFSAVVVPALCRLRSSPQQYRHAYCSAVRLLVWISIPLVGLLFCAAEPIVLLYLGPKWAEVVPLFQALVPAAWANCFINCSGWVFTSWGHVDRQLIWGIIHSLVVVVVIACCVPFGVTTVAFGVSAAYVLMRLPGFYLSFQGTPLKLRDLGEILWRPTLLALTASSASFWASGSWFAEWTLINQLFALTGLYIAIFLGAALVLPGTANEIRHLRSITQLRTQQQ